MSAKIRLQLYIMMFVQFFIWGAWFVTMGTFLTRIGFQGSDIGSAYSTTAWAAIISSFFVSLIADKYFSAERLMAVLHLIGGALMFLVAQIKNPVLFFWALLAYTICYMPTIALANTITFHQTAQPGIDFPRIRVLGTIGRIVAGLIIGFLGIEFGPYPMQMAAGMSILFGFYCLTLPRTPPKSREAKVTFKAILGIDALRLLKERSFAVLIISSLLISLPFAAYFNFTNLYLNEIGVANAAAKMTLGQAAEVIFMWIMPFFFVRLGVKKMILLGMLGWIIRFALLGFGNNAELVWFLYLGILLHGLSYDFFYVTGQIYADNKAPKELRASVQGLMTFITYGVGWLLGSVISGFILQKYQILGANNEVIGHNWPVVMFIPAVYAAGVTVFFLVLFKDEKQSIVAK